MLRRIVFSLIALVVVRPADSAHAQFTTVINVPPEAAPAAIGTNTQLNLSDGGIVPSSNSSPFFIGEPGGASTNVELNISGGMLGAHAEAFAGSTVNLSVGRVLASFEAYQGSVVNISGGQIDPGFRARDGSLVNISGGRISSDFFVETGGHVNITGGAVEQLATATGTIVNMSGGFVGTNFDGVNASGQLNVSGGAFGRSLNIPSPGALKLFGGDFRLDGAPIAGLGTVGDSIPFNLPTSSALSGTLADGTPFVFSQWNSDFFSAGTITLVAAAIPPAGPPTITASTDPIPLGVREGQTLLVDSGAVVPTHFNAGRGSTVVVQPGGSVGQNLKAVTATVNVVGGATGGIKAFAGTHVAISTGSAVGDLIAVDSTVDVTGGTVNYIDAIDGSTINLNGGSVGGFRIEDGGTINFQGGFAGVQQLFVRDGGALNMSGGTLGGDLFAGAGSEVSLSGGAVTKSIVLTGGNVEISGGTFDFLSGSSGSLRLLGNEFRIDGAPVGGLGSVGSSVLVAVPAGSLLSGTLADGTPFAISPNDGDSVGSLALRLEAANLPAVGPPAIVAPGDSIPAGIRQGQSLTVASGGVVGENFSAGLGSSVNVQPGGAIGENFEAIGSLVDVHGGTVGPGMDAFAGSEVNIFAGSIGGAVDAHAGSVVNLHGGSIGLGWRAFAGSELNIFGTDFKLDGAPIAGLLPGQEFMLTHRTGVLSGLLTDGSAFSLPLTVSSRSGTVQMIASDALLTLTQVPEPSALLLAAVGLIVAAGRNRSFSTGRRRFSGQI